MNLNKLLLLTSLVFTNLLGFAQKNHAHAPVAVSPDSTAKYEHAEGDFKIGEMIMHHISDAHQIHFGGSLYLPLPVIVLHDGHLDIFSSSNFYSVNEHGELDFRDYKGYRNHHEMIEYVGENATHDTHGHTVLDFSITKSVFGMLLIIALMIIIFRSVAKKYSNNPNTAPSGFQNLLEPFILFIRDDLAAPAMGPKKAEKYVPFLLTVFFFIWMCNLLGLVPFLGGFNITGTLSITLVLAVLVFLITSISGNKHYWGHIFWPPGVPVFVKVILVPIEIMSIFIKPAVLMIRLTANITAGHIVILAFVGLALMFGQKSELAGYSVGIGSVLFMIFMYFLELLVAFLQAYVFTLLAAMYFGDATQEHHAEHAHS
ncbi:MAG: F0F1 ATP synthase subunit A [Bacteroidetes bacterium]|nr:F0F1 ATP synthase subunit A [Bacteroidota bacterium]